MFIDKCKFSSIHSVKNNIDLIHKINNVTVRPGCRLISFDVASLFTSIPILKLRDLVYSHIDVNILDVQVNTEMKRLFEICINQNYFAYKGRFYSFKDGLPMGSPLSPLLAEVFMDAIEVKILGLSCPYRNNIEFWYRYVDDILCYWNSDDIVLNNFLEWLNNLDDNIKFTLEVEEDNSLNFLYIKIINQHNKFQFEIFRKETFCDNIIPYSSCHPDSVKAAAFYSMIDRLLNIPMSNLAFDKELNLIKNIAVNNGYPESFIDKLLFKKERSFILNSVCPGLNLKNDKKWIKLAFVGKTSYKIANILRKTLNCNVAFYNNNNLKKFLVNNKNETEKLNKSGVYMIKCQNCECKYIGQTGRDLKLDFH